MVAARLQEQHGMFRLFGCLVVQLFGCSAVQLLGRSAESVGRPRDGSTSPEMPVAFRRFCPESGSDSLFGPAFRTCFGIGFRACFAICFGTGFRICFSGLLQDLLQDLLRDLLSDQLSGPAFRTCFRGCFPDAGAILFDCGMRSVVPIRPQDSSAQFLPQQLPAAGV